MFSLVSTKPLGRRSCVNFLSDSFACPSCRDLSCVGALCSPEQSDLWRQSVCRTILDHFVLIRKTLRFNMKVLSGHLERPGCIRWSADSGHFRLAPVFAVHTARYTPDRVQLRFEFRVLKFRNISLKSRTKAGAYVMAPAGGAGESMPGESAIQRFSKCLRVEWDSWRIGRTIIAHWSAR